MAAPFFSKVNGPLFLLLLLLMGVGPLLLAGGTPARAAFRKQFTWPLAAARRGRPRLCRGAVSTRSSVAICAFVAATIVQEYVRGVLARRKTSNDNALMAMAHLWSRNGRRYGGYIVHLGIVLIGVAVIGNEFYQQTTNVTLAPGQTVQIAWATRSNSPGWRATAFPMLRNSACA